MQKQLMEFTDKKGRKRAKRDRTSKTKDGGIPTVQGRNEDTTS